MHCPLEKLAGIETGPRPSSLVRVRERRLIKVSKPGEEGMEEEQGRGKGAEVSGGGLSPLLVRVGWGVCLGTDVCHPPPSCKHLK